MNEKKELTKIQDVKRNCSEKREAFETFYFEYSLPLLHSLFLLSIFLLNLSIQVYPLWYIIIYIFISYYVKIII